ncbi:MAG: putative 26 proteasome complex subunit Sem1 [Piptocephalis tieghemiana]|nr:MAG: putative 26 proteasome complex subunit Sem1 [Piptocephalis tieghemiana]
MSTAQTDPTSRTAATPSKVDPPRLGALEEDDEFEEFAVEDWGRGEEDKEAPALWEDTWDDDDVEDDFSKQLREELAKTAAANAKAST